MDNMTTDVLPQLEKHLGYWLRLASNHVSADFAQGLHSRHVSVAEWVALRHVYDHGGITPSELAERLGMTRGAVSKVLEKLQSKGWVETRTKPEDQRVQLLYVTPAGVRLLPELAEIADNNDRKYFSCFDEPEHEQLASLLRKLASCHQWTDVPVE